jgi:sugar phosphate isomerase/epimerase
MNKMANRREFLRNAGALAVGSLFVPGMLRGRSLEARAAKGIGIQIYTLNSFMGTDPKATFAKLADIGFKNIETAFSPLGAYYGFKPKELKTIIEDLGMKWVSHHVMGAPFGRPPAQAGTPTQSQPAQQPARPAMPAMATLRDSMQQLVDEAAEGGLEFLVCASTPISTLEEIKLSVETFVKAGEACKKAGIQFAYHNHATEWDQVEGKTPYELILSQTDKDLVKMEIDLAWAAKAKQNPVELFKGNPGRFPLFHVKDFDLVNNKIVAIGQGSVDFKTTFAAAKSAGLKYFFYEQDSAKSMDDVILSYNNLGKIV